MEKSQIDPAKITEFEYNVNRILRLIRDGDIDGTPEELTELIQDVYNQYILYRDHPEGNNLGLQNQITEFEKNSKEREEELSKSKGPKTEIEDKMKRILELIKDGNLDMDGTPEEILKREPLAELVKDIECITDELNVLKNKVESLQHLKSELEAQHEETIREHSENKTKLLAYFKVESDNKLRELKLKNMEVEEQLRASELELNTLRKKASDYENQTSENKNQTSQLTQKNLEQEEELGKLKKGLSARKLECRALQRKIAALTAKVDNQESLQLQKSDLEVQLVDKSKENSEFLIQIESLKKEVGRKTEEQERLLEDKEYLTRELRDLELEMSTLMSKDEEQIRANIQEISHLQDKINKAEEEALGKITAFTAKVDDLQKDLLSMQKTKEELEICCEKLREEKNELAKRVMDLQGTLKEQEDTYQKLNKDYKEVDSRLGECKVELEVENRKNKDISGELRKCIATKNQMVDDLKDRVEDLKTYLEKKGNETSTLLESVVNHEEELRQKLQ